MALLSYFDRENNQRVGSGVLGILHETELHTKFYELGTDDFDRLVSADWFKNFSCQIDIGSCTFSKEFKLSGETTKGYWYASKKINGKLRRVYFGNKPFTIEALHITLAKFEKPVTQEVTQNNSVVQEVHKIGDRIDTSMPDEHPPDWNVEAEQWKRIASTYQDSCKLAWDNVTALKAEIEKLKAIANPTISLAGNGKNENHLQPNVIDCFESLAIAQNEIIVLNKMLKDGDNFLREANEKNHEQRVEVGQLKRKLSKLEKTLSERDSELHKTHEKLLERASELAECKQLLIIRGQELNETVAQLESAYEMNAHLQMSIDSLEVGLKIHQRDYQDLNDRHLGVKNLHGEALTYIHKLESDIEKLQEYNRVGEQEAFDNLNTFEAIMPVIGKYRTLADGKTKKANPRYAYLIDFLADIDKIS